MDSSSILGGATNFITMIDVKEKLEEEGPIRKYGGIAPDGFELVHEYTLESLKDDKVWSDWKSGKVLLRELNNQSLSKEKNDLKD